MSSQKLNQSGFFKITDLILALGLLLLSGICFGYFSGVKGNTTVIYINNIKHASFDLGNETKTRYIAVRDKRFQIEYGDGKIRMLEAPCHHKICVKQGFIHTTDKKIICVPNKILIGIENDIPQDKQASDIDATTF